MRPIALLTCLLLAAGAPLAHAATDAAKAAAPASAKQKAAGVTAEDKAAAKAEAKSKRDSMTPEEKAEAKKRRGATKADGTAGSADKKDAAARKPAAPLPAPSAGPN